MKKVFAFLALLGFIAAGLAAWSYFEQQAAHRREVERLQKERAELKQCIDRLCLQERVAQVMVRGKGTDDDGRTCTSLSFLEWDRDGRPLPAVDCNVVGSEVYFDALVIRFQDEYVEKGDSLRGKSLVLFRRIFGSAEPPDAGTPIDNVSSDGIPLVYRVKENPSSVEKDLWERFWYYVDHPEESEKLGVRVMQIEAVGARLSVGAVYELRLEADGGLNLTRVTSQTPQ